MRNLIVVDYFFPPIDTIAARRYGAMTAYMESSGWRPWIITSNSIGATQHRLPESQVLRIGNQYKDPGHVTDTAAEGQLSRVTQKVHGLATRHKLTLRSFDTTVPSWAKQVIRNLPDLLKSMPSPHAILGTFGPAGTLWVARRLASNLDIPWIADFRDLAALRPDGRDRWVISVDSAIERIVVRNASGFTTVSPTLGHMISERYRRPCEVIFNGWEEDAIAPERSKVAGAESDTRYIYYGGRTYIHRLDAFEVLFSALAQVEGLEFWFQSLGPIEIDKKIIALAVDRGVAHRVRSLPLTDLASSAQLAAGATANLVVEDLSDTELWSRGTLTGKLMAALRYPSPIVAIARSDSDMLQVLRDTKKGDLASTTPQLVELLRVAVADSSRWSGDQEAIAQYSRRSQAKKLCEFLSRIVVHEHA